MSVKFGGMLFKAGIQGRFILKGSSSQKNLKIKDPIADFTAERKKEEHNVLVATL